MANADANEIFDAAAETMARAVYIALASWLRKASMWMDRASPEADLPALIARGAGHVSLISSVAGFRGLPKSLAYGPTKAALTNLAENLYLDMEPPGVGVSVIHPGFVQTPLTAQNKFTMPALITPEQAAQATIAGWAKGEFEIHYPKRFTHVMKLLRLLPYRAYFPAVRRATGL